MESIGLMPSSTGKPGGKRTGDRMSDYPIPGGRFEKVAEILLATAFHIPWVDRYVPGTALPGAAGLASQAETINGGNVVSTKPKNKIKYAHACEQSGEANLWGKPDLAVACAYCGQRYEPAEATS